MRKFEVLLPVRRHLSKECSLRFGQSKDEHLIWMLNLLILENPETEIADPASLNAALFVSDVRKSNYRNQVLKKLSNWRIGLSLKSLFLLIQYSEVILSQLKKFGVRNHTC